MSRIAKKPINIPKGVEVNITGQSVTAKGPVGSLSYEVHELVNVQMTDNTLLTTLKDVVSSGSAMRRSRNEKFRSSIVGTMRSILNNLILGVSSGFEKRLLLTGVGFRAQLQGKKLNLSLGFSHPVNLDIPDGITIEINKQTEIVVKGADKSLVGQVAANIRVTRPVEPYKGKGIRYSDESVVLKETKK